MHHIINSDNISRMKWRVVSELTAKNKIPKQLEIKTNVGTKFDPFQNCNRVLVVSVKESQTLSNQIITKEACLLILSPTTRYFYFHWNYVIYLCLK